MSDIKEEILCARKKILEAVDFLILCMENEVMNKNENVFEPKVKAFKDIFLTCLKIFKAGSISVDDDRYLSEVNRTIELFKKNGMTDEELVE